VGGSDFHHRLACRRVHNLSSLALTSPLETSLPCSVCYSDLSPCESLCDYSSHIPVSLARRGRTQLFTYSPLNSCLFTWWHSKCKLEKYFYVLTRRSCSMTVIAFQFHGHGQRRSLDCLFNFLVEVDHDTPHPLYIGAFATAQALISHSELR
jgi:hypothetical protein